MANDVLTLVANLVKETETFNANVARKLSLGVSQLREAKSVEEYQQIGILIRDTLIEFGQCLYRSEMLPRNAPVPSDTDAKRMIEYSLRHYGIYHNNLNEMIKTCYSYANAIQHHPNAKRESVIQVLSMTALCFSLIIESLATTALYKKRPYYKCPNCGGLELENHLESIAMGMDHDWRTDKVSCSKCGWYYIEKK